MAEEQKEQKEKLARGTVARGRTVAVPHPTKKKVVGSNPETGKPIYGPVMTDHGPGQEVTLPESEIASLRERGFLVDPSKSVIDVQAEGSHFKETASS